jgi:hypothetical protein
MKDAITKPHKILLYASHSDLALEGLSVVTSPITCLNEVTRRPFDMVAVSFHQVTLKERKALVDLCSALRTNPHSEGTLLLCLVPSRHRDLLAGLKDAGVRYVMFLESPDLDWSLAGRLQSFAENRSGAFPMDSILEEICPYIHYVPISRRREILYCRAYFSRLVLGPYLLNLYCETSNHIHCPYFLEPRFAKLSSTKT